MCEANAFLLKDDGEEELVMESVDILRPEGENVYIRDIFGDQRLVKARIKEMNLIQHRIILVED
jgi:predicted RNA-binding protein